MRFASVSKAPLLIRNAELLDGGISDLRLERGRVVAMGVLSLREGETAFDAGGGLLLPGLHDHHLHLAAAAAALASVACGPPSIAGEAALAEALSAPGEGWLRGVGYHDSVAGPIDRRWLDSVAAHRPVRVQHRSGRLWIFNTFALETLLADADPTPEGLERDDRGWTGRLFDNDAWLRERLGASPPAMDVVGATLSRMGVTGVTDMTPSNDDAVAAHFHGEHRRGALLQRLVLAGRAELGKELPGEMRLGPVKLHLHEAHLPDYDATVAAIRSAHAQDRPVAVHCVTEVELWFILGALREAGAQTGDRIEHASLAGPEAVDEIASLGLAVVTQPNFVAERGDAYRRDIAAAEWANLYRLRTWLQRGVALAGATDAPFGGLNPWAAMAAAVSRRTAGGDTLGQDQALTPREALDLFLADPLALGRTRRVEVGMAADLCLLDRPWRQAQTQPSAAHVRATLIDGRVVHDRFGDAPTGSQTS